MRVLAAARDVGRRDRRMLAIPGIILSWVALWLLFYPEDMSLAEIGAFSGVVFPAIYLLAWWVLDYLEIRQRIKNLS